MEKWELKLDKQLIRFEGRRLAPEKIVQGNNVMYSVENVDWTNNLRSSPLLQSGILDHWLVITVRRNSQDTAQFVQLIQRAGNGMSFRVGQPRT